MADSDAEEKDARRIQSLAAFSIGLICLLIGLPVWWKTTEVYRVQLPYSDIESLANIEVLHTVNFRVVSFADGINLPELQTLVHFEDNRRTAEKHLRLQYVGTVSRSSLDEQNVFSSALNVLELDKNLQQLIVSSDPADYTVYIVPVSDSRFKRSTIGTGHAAFIQFTKDIEDLGQSIRHVVQDVFVREDAVYKTLQSTSGAGSMTADKESMRSLRSSPGYELTFTMLNPEPDLIRAKWNVGSAVQMYLEPMLSLFSDYAKITVKSQCLYYTGLGVRAEKTANGSRLSSEQLPHIINPIEAYLGSHVSTNPNINFIVYIPTRDQRPLHIYGPSGERSSTNAFMSPRWGGLMVYNVDVLAESPLPVHVDINMKQVFTIFIAQLRLILGIHSTMSDDQLEVISPANRIISSWELDQWLRERCIENIFTSAATLRSLAELLDKISNIVINDDIGAQVVTGVQSIQQSVDLLASGQLRDAYLVSRQARQASEKAFFDPSLLELLYFPEDQKFAIYIPLFLPVGFPIVLSMIEAIKWLRGSKTKQKEE